MEHIETLLRRAIADGMTVKRLMLRIAVFSGMPLIERIHPLQGGYPRKKVRRTRRPGSPPDIALLFYLRHWAGTVSKIAQLAALVWRIDRVRARALREHAANPYTDIAIAKLPPEAEGQLELLQDRPALEMEHAD